MSAVKQLLDSMGFVPGVGFPDQDPVEDLEQHIDPRIAEITSKPAGGGETVIIQGFPFTDENGLVPAWDIESEHIHVSSEVTDRELWLNQKLAEAMALLEQTYEDPEYAPPDPSEIFVVVRDPIIPGLPGINWKPLAFIAAGIIGIWALFKR